MKIARTLIVMSAAIAMAASAHAGAPLPTNPGLYRATITASEVDTNAGATALKLVKFDTSCTASNKSFLVWDNEALAFETVVKIGTNHPSVLCTNLIAGGSASASVTATKTNFTDEARLVDFSGTGLASMTILLDLKTLISDHGAKTNVTGKGEGWFVKSGSGFPGVISVTIGGAVK